MHVASKRARALAVVRKLRAEGFTAYFAGGSVRDLLLGVSPKDYDVATNASAETVRRLFPATVPVGVQFGVVLVVVDGEPVEVATFRSDGTYVDARHPTSVRFGTEHEDAQRRDFTINGMFYDPITERVIDHVGGEADLRRRLVRAIGDPRERFREDRLRLVRAVRLAARLGFEIEEHTWAALVEGAPGITEIAWERIGAEVVMVLTEGAASRGVEMLSRAGLLAHITPEIEALRGVPQSPDYHPEGDVFAHTILVLAHLDRPSETLALGALLHDVGKPFCLNRTPEGRITFRSHTARGAEMAVSICQRLKRSRQVWERVAYLVRSHLRHLHVPEMRLSALKRFLREDGIEELLALIRADALASHGDLRLYTLCREKLAEFGHRELRPDPVLTGADLIAAGYVPGPRFSEILSAVEGEQLEGRLRSREEALQWVADRFGRPPQNEQR